MARGLCAAMSGVGLGFALHASVLAHDVRDTEPSAASSIVVRVRPGLGEDRLWSILQSDAVLQREIGPGWAADVHPTMVPAVRDLRLAAELGLDRYYTIDLNSGVDLDAVKARASARTDLFETVERVGLGNLTRTPPVNDPLFGNQWHLQNTGQPVGSSQTPGTPGADIKCVQAWAAASFPNLVVIAILDSGVSARHPDLVPVLVPGQNMLSSTNPTYTDDSRTLSHGTYCAGVAAAATNNGIGIAGVAGNGLIMPVKVLTAQIVSAISVGNGLMWAADNGARVASMSLSFGEGTDVSYLQTAAQYAQQKGVLMLASTGNTPGIPIGAPANFPQVMAIGATDDTDQAFSAETTGPEMDVVAPGVNIYTTVDETANPEGYGWETGTSLSCPMVAGVAALIWGADPALTAAQVRKTIEVTADDLGPPGWDTTFGYGRVNAWRAVSMARHNVNCPADANNDGTVNVSDIFVFLSWYFAGDVRADFNHDGNITVGDIFTFLADWFQGVCTP